MAGSGFASRDNPAPYDNNTSRIPDLRRAPDGSVVGFIQKQEDTITDDSVEIKFTGSERLESSCYDPADGARRKNPHDARNDG